ncbi:MAG: HAD family phosphatase [Firmicutes bacterium]|nr:HAD family phosphatase [Bacillota bacterium]
MCKKRAVIFDMDGVIIDSEQLIMRLMIELGVARGLDRSKLELATRNSLGVNRVVEKKMYEELFPGIDYDELHGSMGKLYWEHLYAGKLPLKPGVFELLEWLKSHDYLIALATSTKEETARKELELLGVLKYFDTLTCGDMLKKSKPEPDIYLMACDSLGIEPAGSFAVEDSFNGVRSASSAGLFTIMVPDLIQPTEEIRDLTCAVLPSLHDVIEYLKDK